MAPRSSRARVAATSSGVRGMSPMAASSLAPSMRCGSFQRYAISDNSRQRHNRPQRMDAGHAVDLKLAARRRGDRAGEFAPRDRVAGKAKARERRQRFANGRKARQRGSDIGQIGPLLHHLERPRIGEAAAADLLGEDEVEPRTSSKAVKISRTQNDDA